MITADVKTHVVILKDKGRIFLTADQEVQFWQGQMQGSKGIKVNGEYVDYNMVGRVLPISRFYEEYPKERQEVRNVFAENYPEYVRLPVGSNQQIRQPNKNAAEQMKKAFIKQQIESGISEEDAAKKFEGFTIGKRFGEREYWRDVIVKYKDKTRNETEEEHYQHALKKLQTT